MSEKKWVGSQPVECNLCKVLLTPSVGWFADASLPLHRGSWAIVCPDCFKEQGCKVGVGMGQRYDIKTLVKLEG